MTIMEKLGSYFGTDAGHPERVVKQTMQTLYAMNITELISESEAWQPQPTFCSFRDEMIARCKHLEGSLQSDIQAILKRRFPQTYTEIEKEQVNIRLYQKLIRDRAKIFMNPGKFDLVDEKGEVLAPDDPSQILLHNLIDKSQIVATLRDTDRYCQALHRVAVKAWWDKTNKCARLTLFPQHLVRFAPDKNQYWSADAARGVGFELPPEDGINNIGLCRYEIWAKRKINDTWYHSHYVTGSRKNGDKDPNWYDESPKGNENNIIPFVDPVTQEPIYPFVWWQDDALLSLYWVGDEDALTIPRMLSSFLTDVNHGFHYGVHPMISWENDTDIPADPPPQSLVGPGKTLNVVGIHPRFTNPGFDPSVAVELWKTLVELERKIDGGNPVSITGDQQTPISGYGMKIQNIPQTEIRQELIPIYKPQVEDSVRRWLIIHNTYAPENGLPTIDLTRYHPRWTPGDIDIPVDEEARDRTHAARIAANVETAVDWRMDVTGENEETAKNKIEENTATNKQSKPEVPAPGQQFPARKFGLNQNMIKTDESKTQEELKIEEDKKAASENGKK